MDQLLQKIGQQVVLIDVLQDRLRLKEEELKEAREEKYYSEPVRVPQKRPDNERM